MSKKLKPPTSNVGYVSSKVVSLTHEAFQFSYRTFVVGRIIEARVKSIIDLGCGEGALWKDLCTNRYVSNYLGADARDMSRHFPRPELFVCRDIRKKWPDVTPAECVVLAEVVEHFTRPDSEAVIRNAAHCTKKGGIIVLTTPCEDGHKYRSMEDEARKFGHLYYWGVSDMRKLFKSLGFEFRFWKSRFLGDKTSWAALSTAIRAAYGNAGVEMAESLRDRYGQRVAKAILFQFSDTKPSHMNVVAVKK